MNKVLAVAALGEAATGLALLAYPPFVVRLLLGTQIAGAGIVTSRIAGIALLALGLACWPGSDVRPRPYGALQAMLGYSLLVTFYLGFVGVAGERVGTFLWPAVGFHAVVTILLARTWLK